jgi:hypothetical protein
MKSFNIPGRLATSPGRFWFMWWTAIKWLPNLGSWTHAKKLSMDDFSKYINKFKYYHDPGKGHFDYTIQIPQAFFKKLNFGRDCDDFSYIWRMWCKRRKYKASTYVLNGKDDTGKTICHMICIANAENDYWLMDYRNYGPYKTKEAVLDKLEERWDLVQGYELGEYRGDLHVDYQSIIKSRSGEGAVEEVEPESK